MKSTKSIAVGLTLISAAAILASCVTDEQASNSSENTNKEDKLKVVTTFYPMYDFTRNVTQDSAEVSLLLPAGTDVHSFEPSAKEVAEIQEADVFIYNSEEMETWVPAVLDTIDLEQVQVIDAGEGISLIENESTEEHEEHEYEADVEEEHLHAFDPHIWLDPVFAQEEVTTIKEGLIIADPENQESYEANAVSYNQELEALNQEYQTTFKDAKNRTFVTQHTAFGYLAKRYDLIQVSIAGLTTEEEPSPAKLAELSEIIKEEKIEYIYFEDNASSKIAETLANEVGVELALLSPLAGVSQEDQEDGIDYIEVMKKNLDSLKKSIR
ncbi:metal ABC transporter substrate-binding protein [Carnobacterium sp. ISL-102]|uniref:metal ABC transporter substrate-binding protein n=1 Tax=Carnobacterium sp. ISL-102 TaxID=2819142 RepID=UPI002036036A|nr:metal ABC transporter substrate-binding protein [Carnobacterium sp. ISL-102]